MRPIKKAKPVKGWDLHPSTPRKSKKYAYVPKTIYTGQRKPKGPKVNRKGEIFGRIKRTTLHNLMNTVAQSDETIYQLADSAKWDEVSVVTVDDDADTELHKDLDFLILDVRSPEEYEQCHVDGAISYPAVLLNQDKFPAPLYSFKAREGKIVVVYAEDEGSGGPQGKLGAATATNFFQKGFTNVKLLTGGLKYFADKYADVHIIGQLPSHLVKPVPKRTVFGKSGRLAAEREAKTAKAMRRSKMQASKEATFVPRRSRASPSPSRSASASPSPVHTPTRRTRRAPVVAGASMSSSQRLRAMAAESKLRAMEPIPLSPEQPVSARFNHHMPQDYAEKEQRRQQQQQSPQRVQKTQRKFRSKPAAGAGTGENPLMALASRGKHGGPLVVTYDAGRSPGRAQGGAAEPSPTALSPPGSPARSGKVTPASRAGAGRTAGASSTVRRKKKIGTHSFPKQDIYGRPLSSKNSRAHTPLSHHVTAYTHS